MHSPTVMTAPVWAGVGDRYGGVGARIYEACARALKE